MTRLLILGRTGQLAKALAAAATESGGGDITCAGSAEADLSRRGAVSALIDDLNPDLVVNAAAYTAVDDAERNPDLAFAVNAEGAEEAALAARRNGARYVLISTDHVFGGDGRVGPFSEQDATAPVNAYGRTKLEGERRVSAAYPEAAIARTSALFSGGGADFPSAIWRLAESRDVLRVVSDQLTAPTYAHDLASQLLALARHPEAEGLFHLVGAPFTDWASLAKAALDISRSAGGPTAQVEPVSSSEFPMIARRPSDSRLGGTRFDQLTGLDRADWRNGLAPAFAAWRSMAGR